MDFPVAAAILLAAVSAQGQTDTSLRCSDVRVDDGAVGRIIGIPGDRVTWSRAGVFVNGSPAADVCDADVAPPFPLPGDVPSVEVTVPPAEYFVVSERHTDASRSRPATVTVVQREFGLVAADRVTRRGR